MRQATLGHVKGVALRMGKSEDWVYKMLAQPECCTYTRFLASFTPIFQENQNGAEEIAEDFLARLQLLREQSGKTKSQNVDWLDAIAKAVEESSQAIKASLEDRDPLRIEKEITDAIETFRSLLKIVVRREESRPRAIAAGGNG